MFEKHWIFARRPIVSEGQIISEGTAEEILDNQKVREVYLGDQFKI